MGKTSDLIRRADAKRSVLDELTNDVVLKEIREKPLVAIPMAVVKALNELPSADAVEVVRCKDCRHGERDAVFVYCTRYYRRIGTEDYCSSGERRKP